MLNNCCHCWQTKTEESCIERGCIFIILPGLSLNVCIISCNDDSEVVIKSGIHRLNYPVECAFEPSADSEKKCTKSLYVYVCVLEHNASTLELLWKMRKKNIKSGQGFSKWGVNATFKAMCSERWQSDNGWDPKCTMGDMTWLAVLLLFALSFSCLLWSVQACSPERRDTVMLTPGFLVISVCLCNNDWLIPWCFVNRATMLTWTISVMLW